MLFKRGFGITLNESLNAAEYLASEGNSRVVFCLRGVKTNMGDPHRNLVDFSHVPVVKRLTRMPVCVDPSHSVGSRERAPDGILDLMHATAQGVVAGANMVLVDFHPAPAKALVDGPQALLMSELGWFLEDVAMARECYEKHQALAERQGARKALKECEYGQGIYIIILQINYTQQHIPRLIQPRRQIGRPAVIGVDALNQTAVGGLNFVTAGTGLQTQNLVRLGPVHGPGYFININIRLAQSLAPVRVGVTIQISLQHRHRLRVGLTFPP